MNVQQRLAEIRERCKFAIDLRTAVRTAAQLSREDIPYLLDLVDRLMEFVPVPEVVSGSVGVASRLFVLAYPDGKTVGAKDLPLLLTACEVHGIEPPAWMVARAQQKPAP